MNKETTDREAIKKKYPKSAFFLDKDEELHNLTEPKKIHDKLILHSIGYIDNEGKLQLNKELVELGKRELKALKALN